MSSASFRSFGWWGTCVFNDSGSTLWRPHKRPDTDETKRLGDKRVDISPRLRVGVPKKP